MASNNVTVRYIGDGCLTIDFGKNSRLELVIYNAAGQVCQSATTSGQETARIHLGSLPNGAYHMIAFGASDTLRSTFVVYDR